MSKKCRNGKGGKAARYLETALVGIIFVVALGACGQNTSDAWKVSETEKALQTENLPADEKIQENQNMDEEPITDSIQKMTDLTDAFEVILQGATKEFIAGYRVDESFLMWLFAEYGEETVLRVAYSVLDQEMDCSQWYELTGNTMHVLWLEYCRDTGYQKDVLENIYWVDCSSSEETVFSFTGDFNFAEGWYTTEYMESQPNGIYDCFSKDLLAEMNASDILMMNNEFVYSSRGKALEGKAYTFRAKPEMAELLSVFGVDIVSLANNHTYDYGADALLDTMEQLDQAGVSYIGAGENLAGASRIAYYVANGRKIAIVSATEIERYAKYTKEADEDSCGVLKTLKPERFLKIIQEADQNSDYVIVVPHWGAEGTLYPDQSQRTLARLFAEAGADAIIGGHTHRLQGVYYINEVPTAYSLGNFWFSNGTLYTTVAQVIIKKDGSLQLKYLPCIQKDLTTSLITDKTEMDAFYQYLAAISSNIGIDAEGNIYPGTTSGYGTEIVYDSETSTTPIVGGADNEGNAIDIVGNLK